VIDKAERVAAGQLIVIDKAERVAVGQLIVIDKTERVAVGRLNATEANFSHNIGNLPRSSYENILKDRAGCPYAQIKTIT